MGNCEPIYSFPELFFPSAYDVRSEREDCELNCEIGVKTKCCEL